MNFVEIKERLLSELKQLWDRIQDSTIYNQLRDRYGNLSPQMQKITLLGFVFVVGFLFFSVPWGYWQESNQSVTQFENRRDLIRKLLKSSRDASDVPDIPAPPSSDSLTADIQNILTQNQLLAEQIKGVNASLVDSNIIPSGMAQGGVTVTLTKLNLKQIVEVGYKIKAISPTVKMTGMQITPNRESPQYLDVVFKLASLMVPEALPPPPIEEEPAPKRPSSRKKSTKAEDEE